MDFLKEVIRLWREARRKSRERKEFEAELSGGLTRSFAVKIAERHGLAGKIAFKFPKEGPTELILLSENGKSPDLPGEFLKDLLWALINAVNFKECDLSWFKITTMEKKIFDEHIDAWVFHCEMFWASYGG